MRAADRVRAWIVAGVDVRHPRHVARGMAPFRLGDLSIGVEFAAVEPVSPLISWGLGGTSGESFRARSRRLPWSGMACSDREPRG